MKGPSFAKQLEPQTIAGFLLSDSWSSLWTNQHCLAIQKSCSSTVPPNASRKDGWSPAIYGSLEELSLGTIPSCTGPTCWKSLHVSHQFAWSRAMAVKSHSLLCGSCVGSYWTHNHTMKYQPFEWTKSTAEPLRFLGLRLRQAMKAC